MNNYQQRLYDHEVDPPASAWGKIADALEHERIYDFQETLYNATATPPVAVWVNQSRIRTTMMGSSESSCGDVAHPMLPTSNQQAMWT
ncbi:MAG: hypothetical protein EOO05_21970, partial [Chitinophagaceae bacterium]